MLQDLRMPKLTRKYAYYRCQCSHYWESAFTYVHKDGPKVAFKQDCAKCAAAVFPYKTEPLKCPQCQRTDCVCEDSDGRHNDLKKNHRSDLCHKCKAGLPCTGNQLCLSSGVGYSIQCSVRSKCFEVQLNILSQIYLQRLSNFQFCFIPPSTCILVTFNNIDMILLTLNVTY